MIGYRVSRGAMKGELRVLLLTAMPKEYDLVLSWLEGAHALASFDTPAYVGSLGSVECLLIQTGIGKVNAALRSYQGQLQFQPNLVINVGVCGALNPNLSVGSTVLSSAFVYHDVWCGEGNVYGQVQNLPAAYEVPEDILETFVHTNPDLRQGLFTSGDFFMPEGWQLERLFEHFPEACAVDMESTAIAQVCYLHGLPYFSLRVVSDCPVEGLKQAGRQVDIARQYSDFWDNPKPAFEKMGEQLRAFFAEYVKRA